MYYNTTNETGDTLQDYRAKTQTQDEVVMNLFLDGYDYSPSQVQQRVLPNAPITSVRRSITNLTAEGRLTKTGRQVQGLYGRPEYCWRLSDPRQGKLL